MSTQKGFAPILIILVVFLVATVGGGAYLLGRSLPSKSLVTKEPVSNTQPSTTSTDNTLYQPKTLSQEQITQMTKKDGPWNTNLMIAESSDGQSFSNAKVFVERAGVTSITKDSKDRLISAFQYFPVDDPSSFDLVAISTSADQGKTWSKPQTAKFYNMPQIQRPFDPTVASSQDGKIRMFFTSTRLEGDKRQGDPAIYSAISEDGISYTFEEGVKLGVSGKTVIDSAAIQFKDVWHLISPIQPSGGAYHATSSDGEKFSRTQDINADAAHRWLGNFTTFQDSLRFYGTGDGNIWYSTSPEGVKWDNPVSTNVSGGDPAVVELSSSKYLMIYTGEKGI